LVAGGGAAAREAGDERPRPERDAEDAGGHRSDDVERLISSQTSLRDQVVLMCLAWLGLRKSELAALRLGDFNLAAGTVTIRGKGGHEDSIAIGFQRLRGALELHLVEVMVNQMNTCSTRATTVRAHLAEEAPGTSRPTDLDPDAPAATHGRAGAL
jgi:integrase